MESVDKENRDVWNRLNNSLFIDNGVYAIVRHIREIFKRNDYASFKAYLNDYVYELEDVYKDRQVNSEARELTRYLIVKSISLKNVDALNYLIEEKNGEIVRFYSLLQLLNLFHGCYIVDKIATSSDFWSLIFNGRIENPTFLSFHVFNYCFHTGNKLTNEDNYTSNVSNVLNMVKGGEFYDENLIMETMKFLTVFINKLIEILKSSVFDEQFKAFYNKYAPLAEDRSINSTGMDLTQYLSESIMTHWHGETPLMVRKMNSLIEKKED